MKHPMARYMLLFVKAFIVAAVFYSLIQLSGCGEKPTAPEVLQPSGKGNVNAIGQECGGAKEPHSVRYVLPPGGHGTWHGETVTFSISKPNTHYGALAGQVQGYYIRSIEARVWSDDRWRWQSLGGGGFIGGSSFRTPNVPAGDIGRVRIRTAVCVNHLDWVFTGRTGTIYSPRKP